MDPQFYVKYSVIIPVFNAEKTICRCVDSLLAESYSDMEIILVNDGSNDSSGSLCEKYAAEHINIRYIAKENGGVSTARNAGLDAATGTYVVFVDCDDYVCQSFFSDMDQMLAAYPYDLIQFSFTYDDGKEMRERRYAPLHVEGREKTMPHIVNAMCRKTINGPVAKIYRRELIENAHIRFPIGASVAEDRAFNIKYSMQIQSYAVSDQSLYFVSTENENSLTRGRHKDLKQQLSIVREDILFSLENATLPEKENEQYRRANNFGECRSIYHDAKLFHQDHLGWLERQKRLGRICDEINEQHMKYPKTLYCTLISLPVTLRLTFVIDAIAWKLTH